MNEFKWQIESPVAKAKQDVGQRRIRNRTKHLPDNMRVLVIDDNKTVRETVAKILSAIGYNASKAEDGMTAMSRLASEQYELVITDLDMPMLDGYRLCTWLKQESPDTITIIMTGSADAENLERMATGAVDRWILKPFGLTDLCGALDDLGLPVS